MTEQRLIARLRERARATVTIHHEYISAVEAIEWYITAEGPVAYTDEPLRPVMRAILDTGYEGYVAQEFIPTWDDKVAALRHAAEVCDV